MRLSRDEALVLTAFVWAERGTCSRLKVGCVISRDGRILVQGYNGAPPGLSHCQDKETGSIHGHTTEQCLAVHAEQNAISWAARNGVTLEGADMHLTHMPCLACARRTITAGIRSVMWCEAYRDSSGVGLLREAGLNVVKGSLDRSLVDKIGYMYDQG
jgi:dCMP deaminase